MTYHQPHHHVSTSGLKQQLVCTQEGLVVGMVGTDRVLRKKVHSSRHMLRKPRAWALDTVCLEQAKRMGVRYIELHDLDTSIVFRVDLDLFDCYALDIDRGYGHQKALPLEHWSMQAAGARHTEESL